MTLTDGSTDPQSISSNDALWATFQVISGWDTDTQGLGIKILQEAVGLSNAEVVALTNHIHASINDVNAHASEVRSNLCQSQKASIRSRIADRPMLANSFRAVDANMDERRAERIAEIDTMLTQTGKGKLLEWTRQNITPHLKMVSIDHAKRLASENINVGVETKGFCDAGTGAAAAGPMQNEVHASNGISATTH